MIVVSPAMFAYFEMAIVFFKVGQYQSTTPTD
jgi:hypothetical protein